MKQFNKKVLSATVSMMMTWAVCGSIQTSVASDIEIYKDATKGKTNILLMLDTSGSMGISSLVLPKNNAYGSPGDVTVPLCDRVAVAEYNNTRGSTYNIYQWAYNLKDPVTNRTAIKKTVNIGGTSVDYYMRGCRKQINGQWVQEYDRLSRLKDAIIPLLASNELGPDVLMGLGQFSSKTELTIGTASNKLTDGHSGRILVPNAPLDNEQRIKIAREIANIKSLDTTTNEDGTSNPDLKLSSNNYPNVTKAASGTPTVHAYAEAGAYMMGTTTGGTGTNSGQVNTIYDGYMAMQNGSEQAYFICVEVGTTTTTALGATVQQCINNWPGHDSDRKTITTGTLNGGVYKPNAAGTGWIRITTQNDFRDEVNAWYSAHNIREADGRLKTADMQTGWNTFTQLPEGWRYGGWMKVNNEPMDIEPIVGTVWTGYAGGTIGIVSYRTSPFSIKSGTVTRQVTTQGFQDCPSGFSPDPGWPPLCVQAGTWRRTASNQEINNNRCFTPVIGENPISGARNPNGTPKSDEYYNMTRTSLKNEGTQKRPLWNCVQTGYALARSWGNITKTETVLQPIDNAGGFIYSVDGAKNGNLYAAGGSTESCNGNGIYFLTDGAPNSTKDTMARTIMNHSLANGAYAFTGTPTSLTPVPLKSNLFAGETGGWEYIGAYAKKLRNRTVLSNTQKNPADMNIKTAVVGFGASFAGIQRDANGVYDCESAPNQDAKNACLWGSAEYGDGGFYYAENSEDIKNSILKFVELAGAKFESIATGSPTIPVDSLNPIQLQPYGYYAAFEPKPSETTQLWAGNLNKYNLRNGELVDKNLQRLILSTGALNKDAVGLWTNGVKGQLPLGTLVAANGEQNSKRKVFTNRMIKEDHTAVSGTSLAQVNLMTLFADNEDIAKFKYDADKNYWLNFLGYDVGITENIASLADLTSKTEYRELGSVMHSTPVMLTQEGKITVADGKLTTTGRKDYLMFGSTQGALHVVDDEGKEVFAFVPHEMMKTQKNAFIGSGKYEGSGKNNLFYGVDGPWTAHTQYVSKSDGTLTVKDSGRKASDEENAQNLIGMQWVYGGLRMGGKSYYALDLTDIEKPELKFHINPDADNATDALKQMGQSWSKPTLAYVNWGDTRKLVMFVGGGYDPVYETHNANPSGTKGNGVYMFDAHNGDLLWWASDSEKTGASRFTQNNELKYSVVSQINAIDRDGDGLTDHIYFGDLGGQAFRVDFNNRATDTANFVTRAVRLFTEHQGSGLSPRFYEMPSVSIHQDDGSYFAAVAFSSGNRSSPLAGLNSTVSANDAVFVVYDNDVARQDLYKSSTSLNTHDETLTELNFDNGVPRRGQNNTLNGGWKAYFDSDNVGRYKGMNDLYALDGMLYVNVYDRDGTGIGGNCGAGVAGDSYLYQYCLPTGKCDFYSGSGNKANRVKLGAGILGTGLGQGFKNDANTVSLVVNRDEPSALDCSLPANKNLPQCQLFNTQVKLKQMRWYESR
ncbi:pilus assembly protein [Acinetobacter towneri]|uniref:pilus assembly protein n=1 Tax=Acinetobacter towneri TaxID=202956 RepID=UPI0020976F5E|nr:PilC/PilY family type IV pilus protein [Acinetobacter towneri]MCO8059939.1 PilC/PilY family type IV pilus protein [Acinetobacter towneri]MCO8065587.1 PilC/PilY family type IV pilus protein [Acinetobacter towneri]